MAEVVDQFAYQQLKVDTCEDAEKICSALHPDVRVLYLEGNTFGIEASERIAQSLAQMSKLKEAHFRDMYTTRGKDEVPRSLTHLTNGIMLSGAKLRYLDLRDNALGPIGMSGLIKYILSDAALDLEEIYLTNCGLGPQGSTTLSKALGRLVKLRVLEIGRNRLEADGASAVCGALSELSTLETLVMYQNGIMSHGWKEVGDAVASNANTLTTIDFFDNCIKDEGSQALAEGLTKTNRLENLNLSDCLLGPEGFVTILTALSRSDSLDILKKLKFEGNEIEGLEAAQLICELFENRRDDPEFELNLLENEFSDEELEILRSTLGPRILLTMDEDDDEADDDYEAREHNSEDYDDEANSRDRFETTSTTQPPCKRFEELCIEFVNLIGTDQMMSAKDCFIQMCQASEKNQEYSEAQILCTELGLMKQEKTYKRKPLHEKALKFIAVPENKKLLHSAHCRVLQAVMAASGNSLLISLANQFVLTKS